MTSEQDTPEIAIRLREAIEKSGFSQAELARRAGFSKDLMSRYVRGMNPPTQQKIAAIARALNIDPRDLDHDAPPPEPRKDNQFKMRMSLNADGGMLVEFSAVMSLEDATTLAAFVKREMEKFT